MTLLSFTTKQSPARSISGRSRMPRSSNPAPGFTTKRRAASRGAAGRRAMWSAGKSKSKSSVFMPDAVIAREGGRSSIPVRGYLPSGRRLPDAPLSRGMTTEIRKKELRAHRRFDDFIGVLNRLAALDLVDVFHALNHLPPDRVLVVEKAGIVEANEKLAVTGIRIAGPRHRYRPAHMRFAVEFRLELLSGPTGAGSVRTARLRHEAIDDTVEDDTVVEPVLHQFLNSRDMPGRKIGPHLDHDVTFGGLQGQGIFRLCHFSLSLLSTGYGRTCSGHLARRVRALLITRQAR